MSNEGTQTAETIDTAPDAGGEVDTSIETPETGEVDTGGDGGDEVTSPDDAALATIQDAFEKNEEDDGEGGEGEAQTTETAETTAPEPIDPDLLTAANFAGLTEQDLRDTIAAVGKDKTVTAIRTIIEKASAQWAPQQPQTAEGQQQPQQQAPSTPSSPSTPANAPKPPATPAADDPFAEVEAPNYAEELLRDFPEAKPLAETNRKIVKELRESKATTEKLMGFIATIAQQQDAAMAADIYDFFEEIDPKGTVYGPVTGTPTPEQLAKRQRLVEGARAYQQRAGVPLRFSRALKSTHTALGLTPPTSAPAPNAPSSAPKGTKPTQASKPKGDLTPSSPGKAPGRLSSEQQRDQAALATLKKYGWA